MAEMARAYSANLGAERYAHTSGFGRTAADAFTEAPTILLRQPALALGERRAGGERLIELATWESARSSSRGALFAANTGGSACSESGGGGVTPRPACGRSTPPPARPRTGRSCALIISASASLTQFSYRANDPSQRTDNNAQARR
jgi:hypothetical protein